MRACVCVCVGGGGGGASSFQRVSINPLVVKVRNVLDLVHKERERVGYSLVYLGLILSLCRDAFHYLS